MNEKASRLGKKPGWGAAYGCSRSGLREGEWVACQLGMPVQKLIREVGIARALPVSSGPLRCAA